MVAQVRDFAGQSPGADCPIWGSTVIAVKQMTCEPHCASSVYITVYYFFINSWKNTIPINTVGITQFATHFTPIATVPRGNIFLNLFWVYVYASLLRKCHFDFPLFFNSVIYVNKDICDVNRFHIWAIQNHRRHKTSAQ